MRRRGTMKTRTFLYIAPLLLGMAMAQTPPVVPPTSSLLPTPGSIKWDGITVSGSLRSRVEGFDWFQPTSGDNAYAYSGNILRLGFSKKLETWDWNAEFALPFLLGLPSNAQGTGPQQGALGLGSNYFTANS